MAQTEDSDTDGFVNQILGRFGEEKFFMFAAAGTLLLSVGMIYVVSVLSSRGLQDLLPNPMKDASGTDDKNDWLDGTFWAMLLLSIIGAITTVLAFMLRTPARDAAFDIREYDYALLGLGFALTLVGVLNFVAMAGFSRIGLLDEILNINTHTCSPENSKTLPSCDIYQMVQLCLIPGFAILGSLFFVAGSLRQKRDRLEKDKNLMDNPDGNGDKENLSYRSTKFWGGLWYRVGEAVLFALVIYIIMTVNDPQPAQTASTAKTQPPGTYADGLVWILALSLIVGMFIKPAEVLINGIGTRLLNAIEALIKP